MTVSPSVLFYPQPPRPEAALGMVCKRLGYTATADPDEPFDLAIFWTTSTVRRRNAALEEIATRVPVLNLACHDIGKRHVDGVFRSVFGYASPVDPLGGTGRCVRKSNLNAMHDGVVVRRPVRRALRRCVYQRLIDNRIGGGLVEDLRTPIIGGEIPYVYAIRKRLNDRFGDPVKTSTVPPERVFSSAEIESIQRFSRAMGLDCAELDVLRDRHETRIYIVDANPTSWTPTGITTASLERALDRQAHAFERLVRRECRSFARSRSARRAS